MKSKPLKSNDEILHTNTCIRNHFNFRFEKQIAVKLWLRLYIYTMAESKTIPIDKYHTSFQIECLIPTRWSIRTAWSCASTNSVMLCVLRMSGDFRFPTHFRWTITIELYLLFNSLDGKVLSREFIIDMVSVLKTKHPSHW